MSTVPVGVSQRRWMLPKRVTAFQSLALLSSLALRAISPSGNFCPHSTILTSRVFCLKTSRLSVSRSRSQRNLRADMKDGIMKGGGVEESETQAETFS